MTSKKMKSLCVIYVLGAILGLFMAGCSDLIGADEIAPPPSSPPAPSTETENANTPPHYQFYGEGAKVFISLPGTQNSLSAARSAVPSDFIDSSGDLVFAAAITASGAPSDADLVAATYTAATPTEPASVVVPFEVSATARENYVIDIYAFASGTASFSTTSALLHGSATITIAANSASATAEYLAQMTLNTSSTATGNVNLAVSIPAGYALRCNTSGFSVSANSVTATLAAGVYTAEFSLLSNGSDENSVAYVWSEEVNVYPGMTTDTWNNGAVNASGAREITVSQIYSTFYVRGTGGTWIAGITSTAGNDTTGNGSLAKPYATIQKAIDAIKAINDGSTEYTIYVDGTFTASGSTPVANFSAIQSGCSITLKGLDATTKATIDGNNTAQGIKAGTSGGTTANLNLTLENLIVKNGKGTYGGGILRANTHTIYNCEISGNTASRGGGIYNQNGSLTLESGTISGNSASSSGGGIYNNGGIFTISGGTIGDALKAIVATESAYSNKASYGGGIYNNGGTVTLSGGNIFYNYASTNGGGIYSSNATGSKLVMGSGCATTIKYNCGATSGGGIYSGNTFTMQAGTISNNKATNGGGIFIAQGSTTTVSGGTISNNTATRTPSGTGGQGISVWNGTLELKGGAKIDSSNNISLCSYDSGTEQHLKITETLTATGTVATIYLKSYTSGTVVLEADDAALITSSVGKFALSDTDYEIQQDTTTTTNAVVAPKGLETVYLDGTSGNDTNNGSTKANAVKTLAKAITLLKDAAGAKIVIVSPYTLASGETGLLDFSARTNAPTLERYYLNSTSGNYCSGNMLTISSGTVVIKNVTFDGNWKADGGTGSEQLENAGGVLLVVDSGATVTLGTGCTVKNNSRSGDGGGIYNNGGTLKLDGATISGNEASYGGGIYNEDGTFTMSGGTTSGNEASYGGGICNWSGTFTISGGTISGNTATTFGGGIYNASSGTVTMSGGAISGNEATDSNSKGGGIYSNGTLNFSGSAVVNANNDVYLPANKFITITGSLTKTNVATITPDSYTSGTVVLQAANADLLSASIGKFALSNSSYAIAQDDTDDTTKTNAVIVDNTPRATVYLDSSTSGSDLNDGSEKAKAVKTLTRATSILKDAAGAKIIIVSPYTLASGETGLLDFSARTAVTIERYYSSSSDYCSGYMLTISGGTVVIKNVTFDGNWKAGGGTGDEQLANADGSLLYVKSGARVTLGADCIVKNNSTSGVVGGINNAGIVMMSGGTISGNSATQYGGGIYNYAGEVTMSGGEISGNTANDKGGGIYNFGTVTMSDGTIGDNTAKNAGGIYNSSGTVTLSGGTISGNTATSGSGGGIYIYGGSLTLESGTISGNTASSVGGGIYNIKTVTMSGGTISGNSADYGGGVLNATGGTFTMSGGEISGNSAKYGGGIANMGTLYLSGGTISSNTATGSSSKGAGIYNDTTLNFSGAAVVDSGNDVYLTTNKFITITSDLTATGIVAKITPASYSTTTQVLKGSFVSTNYSKFAVTPDSGTNWSIGSDGCLTQ